MSPFLAKSLQVFSISAIGKVLAIATTVLFARWMGPTNLGAFSTFMAIVGLLSTIALLGLPTLQMRNMARQTSVRSIDVLTPITISGFGLLMLVLLASILMAHMLRVTDWMPAMLELRDQVHVLMPLALIALALPRYAGQILVGLGYARTVTLVNQIIQPVSILVLAVIWLLVNEAESLPPENRIVIELLIALFSVFLLYGLVIKRAKLSFKLDSRNLNYIEFRRTWISAFSFAGIGLSQVIFTTTDILVLGFFVTAEQVGIYKIASAAALLLLFPMNSMSSVYAPHIAANAGKEDVTTINYDLQRLTLGILLLTAPLLIVFLLYPSVLIRLLFGVDFIDAAIPLSILAIGAGVQLVIGPVGWALTMTGNENICMRILLLGAGINLVLNLILVPYFQLMGAAIATTISTIFVHLSMMIILKSHTGLLVSIHKKILLK